MADTGNSRILPGMILINCSLDHYNSCVPALSGIDLFNLNLGK